MHSMLLNVRNYCVIHDLYLFTFRGYVLYDSNVFLIKTTLYLSFEGSKFLNDCKM